MNENVAKFAPAAIGASTLLSWFTVPLVGSVAGYNTDSGLLLIALSVAATVLSVKGREVASMVCSGAAGLWMLCYVAYLSSQSEDFFGSEIGPLDFAGFGFWAAVLLPWVVVGLAVVKWRRRGDAQQRDAAEPASVGN